MNTRRTLTMEEFLDIEQLRYFGLDEAAIQDLIEILPKTELPSISHLVRFLVIEFLDDYFLHESACVDANAVLSTINDTMEI